MSEQKTNNARAIRETPAQWEFNGPDGKVASQEVSVSYCSPTVAELKRQRVEAKKRFDDDGGVMWISEELLPMLHCITDLPAGQSHPMPITLEWLENQDIKNLDSIRSAIDADMSAGKSRPAK